MNIIGHGMVIVNVTCIKRLVEQIGESFDCQYLTIAERHTFGFRTNRVQYLASRLAAKKAVLKAMGRDSEQPTLWHEIEIHRLPTGEPSIKLYAGCQELATKLGVVKWLLSISHTSSYAAASAVALWAIV